MNQKKSPSVDAYIFDIDNVIIDTRYSYTDCIRETVKTYLVTYLDYAPSKNSFLSQSDVEIFKLLGGFNDDWDTCYGLLLYLNQLPVAKKTLGQLKIQIDLKKLLRRSKTSLGVSGIENWFGTSKQISIEKIESIFQKLYWRVYIKKETPILNQNVFKQLKSRSIKIGIATGRNLKEARYVLKRFGISPYIDKMITMDHLPHPRFKKPNPYSLIEIIKAFGKNRRYVYVGDLPDDVRMAKAISHQYKISGWGFNGMSQSKKDTSKALFKAGATRVIRNAQELKDALLS